MEKQLTEDLKVGRCGVGELLDNFFFGSPLEIRLGLTVGANIGNGLVQSVFVDDGCVRKETHQHARRTKGTSSRLLIHLHLCSCEFGVME